MRAGRKIITKPHAYGPSDIFARYSIGLELLQVLTITLGLPVDEDMVQTAGRLKELRMQLTEIADPEKELLYIGDEEMAQAEESSHYDFSMAVDDVEFRPFLVPYILDDQERVKGNVVVIAGGAFSIRVNATEGYPVAEFFNSLGYNAFVLQRRVAPYPATDSSLDLQRAIRYLRYHAEDIGISHTDKMVAIGMSGGGWTIMGALNNYYGDILYLMKSNMNGSEAMTRILSLPLFVSIDIVIMKIQNRFMPPKPAGDAVSMKRETKPH